MSYVMAKCIHDMNIYIMICSIPITVDCLQVTIHSLKVEFAMPLSSYGISNTSRHEAIMLQKLSIMLLSSAQKITYYAFENCPLFPKLCHHNWLIIPVYCCIRLLSLMFKLQIVLKSLDGC